MTLEIADEPVAPAGLNAAELKRELATGWRIGCGKRLTCVGKG